MPPLRLTPDIITAAIEGFESHKRKIDDQIAELRAMLSGGPTETANSPEAPARKRRKLSAAARGRMREAQQRRWANVRGEAEPPAAMPEPARPKRQLSAAAKGKLVANLKKARAAKAAKAASVKAKKAAPPRTKTSAKKAAVKAPPAKAAKKATAGKKTAAAPSPAETVA